MLKILERRGGPLAPEGGATLAKAGVGRNLDLVEKIATVCFYSRQWISIFHSYVHSLEF
jgi:hypothetical protein